MTSEPQASALQLPRVQLIKMNSQPNLKLQSSTPDIEVQDQNYADASRRATKLSAFKSLGLLDQFLALWILLAMAIGIILGNFVPSTGPALQKGKFVGVSIPIGMWD